MRLFVEKGHITEFKIFGDFFGKEPVATLESLLQGIRYEREAITSIIKDIDLKEYFGNIDLNDFIELIHGDDE